MLLFVCSVIFRDSSVTGVQGNGYDAMFRTIINYGKLFGNILRVAVEKNETARQFSQ